MKKRLYLFAGLLAALGLPACSPEASDRAPPYTLYRDSFLDTSMRLHWATFDADDSRDYNRNNCEMAARLLNANVDASAEAEGKERNAQIGFWCEPGRYSEEGQVPIAFRSEFPTDVP